jgi:hypothetical protein
MQDPRLDSARWRRENLYSIVNKDGVTVPFERNVIQEKIAGSRQKRKMILKARQFGVSTGCIVDLFDWTVFTRNANACILAHEQDSIKKLFRIVQRLYKFMPEQLKPRIDRGGGSKYEMFFPETNSRIYCDLESRGDTIGRLHVSEAAFMKDSAKLKSTLQAVPLNGRVTIETTANGMGNHFYDMWTDTDSIYEKLFFPWYLFPDYRLPFVGKLILNDDEVALVKKAKKLFGVNISNEQIAFRRFKKAELKVTSHDKTRVTFEQEYPEDDITCFLSSGEAAMDLVKIKKLIDALDSPISDESGLKIYRKPVKGRRYVIGADPAEGVRKDWSVAPVIDVESLEVVAKLRGQWKPSDFAAKLNQVGKMYSSPGGVFPILAVERNNHGHAVLLALDEIHGYPNIFIDPRDERPGWRTDSISRPLMLDRFIDAVEDEHLKVNDKDILSECLTLVDNAGKIEASEGKFDDCITATAIGLQVCLSNSTSVYDDLDRRILV